jgi:hypothetical protein
VSSLGQVQFKVSYQRSPITLVGGIADNIVGGILPVMSVLQSAGFGGILGSSSLGLDEFFADYYPMPGSTLIDNQIGNYPFANMAVAANATIAQPLTCSLLMRCPVKEGTTYQQKLAIMTSLQNTLKNHCTLGGTFTVATPSFYYTNCILALLSDVSAGETVQTQVGWKWDFVKPLVTLQDAELQYNAQMRLLNSGAATNGQTSGSALTVGQPLSLGSPATQPTARTSPGAGVVQQ